MPIIANDAHILSVEAEHYLLKMNALVCNELSVLEQIVEMTVAFLDENYVYFRQLWFDLSESISMSEILIKYIRLGYSLCGTLRRENEMKIT